MEGVEDGLKYRGLRRWGGRKSYPSVVLCFTGTTKTSNFTILLICENTQSLSLWSGTCNLQPWQSLPHHWSRAFQACIILALGCIPVETYNSHYTLLPSSVCLGHHVLPAQQVLSEFLHVFRFWQPAGDAAYHHIVVCCRYRFCVAFPTGCHLLHFPFLGCVKRHFTTYNLIHDLLAMIWGTDVRLRRWHPTHSYIEQL